MTTTLQRLKTRRGDYFVPHFDLWKSRNDISAVAGVLKPGVQICVIGSCFADQAAAYLDRRGYRAWVHPAGELYNAQSVRLELEHVLDGVAWPAEIAVPTPSGYAHRFRKRCSASDVGDLYRRDAEQTESARAALREADVVVVLFGTTTEVWRDSGTGLWANELPEPALFDVSRWSVDYGDIESLRLELSRVQHLLAEHTRAHQVFAVCPIPLNATWSDAPIIAANGRNKALLRMALDLELRPTATYLDLWDWVQAQSRWWTPMRRDGRHLRYSGIDRIMLFAERRLGATPSPLTIGHRVTSFWLEAQVTTDQIVSSFRKTWVWSVLRRLRQRAARVSRR